jgi:multiple sugar transport system ATP-binding protein
LERTLATVTGLREALGSEVLVHFSVAATLDSAPGASDFIEPLGDESSIFVARIHPQTRARDGEPLRLVVNTKRLHFFDRRPAIRSSPALLIRRG